MTEHFNNNTKTMKKNIIDELCSVSDMPGLRENANLNIRAWKAEHEEVYTSFRSRMDGIGSGDMSAVEAMLDLAGDCLADGDLKVTDTSLPGYGTADEMWQRLPQYAKSYVADISRENGKVTKDGCISTMNEVLDYMNSCMFLVPSFLDNLYGKAMKENNDLLRCMYYYMVFDGGSTKMTGALDGIMSDEILDSEDMAMIHSCIGLLVPSSFDLGIETKESWKKVVNGSNPEIWKDVVFELNRSGGNRGRKKEIVSIDDLLTGNKSAIKDRILLFMEENTDAICLAYLLQALIQAGTVKETVRYTTFHHAIEQFTGRHFGMDIPQKRFGELMDIDFSGTEKGSWARAKDIISRWKDIFKDAAGSR